MQNDLEIKTEQIIILALLTRIIGNCTILSLSVSLYRQMINNIASKIQNSIQNQNKGSSLQCPFLHVERVDLSLTATLIFLSI